MSGSLLMIELMGYFDEATSHHNCEMIEKFVDEYLQTIPEPFWTNPSSTSGKFHPEYALNDGGLLRHTVVAMYWAGRWASFLDLSKQEAEIAIIATCLHDTYKGGDNDEWPSTDYTHGEIVCQKLHEFTDQFVFENRQAYPEADQFGWAVAEATRTHMGRWAQPSAPFGTLTRTQQCVALADYAAAQKIYDQLEDVIHGL